MLGAGRLKRSVRSVLAGSLLFGSALTVALVGGALPASAAAVVKIIPVGNGAYEVSSDGTHVWVANDQGNTVSELDASTGALVQTIAVSSASAGASGVSSDGTHVWVTNENDSTVSEISTQDTPTITSFSPASGPVGTVVTIKGTSLNGATKVTFKGVKGTITKDTATEIKVKVPSGAKSGQIEVTDPGGTATSTSKFKVT